MLTSDDSPGVSGLLQTTVLDGRGGGRRIPRSEYDSFDATGLIVWPHLHAEDPTSRTFLVEAEEFREDATRALLEPETRPRVARIDEGLLVILRGINFNEGYEPMNMVSLRFWFDSEHVVSTARRRIFSIEDVTVALEQGEGPKSPVEVVLWIVNRFLERMEPYLLGLDERGNQIEARVFDEEDDDGDEFEELAELRREAIAIRRFIAPQKEALTRLAVEVKQRAGLDAAELAFELAERQTRMVEDVDELVARMGVVDDLLHSRAAERLNQRMWVLSIITAVFLPLGLITGLLGINVGGLPLADSPHGFLWVCLLLVGLVLVQGVWLRRRGWF